MIRLLYMRQKLPAYACEFAGTALALFSSVTVVSLLWGTGAGGPIAGALAAAFAYRRRLGHATVCAKLYHTAGHPCPFKCGYRLVRAGETVIREGEPGDDAYFVERGSLRVTRGGHMLADLGPGAWVGEMSLLLDEPRTATVVATTDAQLRPVTRDSFGRLLAEDPRRTQELVRQLAQRVRDASEKLAGRM